MRKFYHGEIFGFENTKTICVVCNMGPLISSFLLLAYKAAEAYTVVKIQRTLSRRVCTVFASPLPRDRKHPILPRLRTSINFLFYNVDILQCIY